MQIYVTHASGFDFQHELYQPLRASRLNEDHTIVLPHENSAEQFNSKEYLPTCDYVIAEVSYPSVGQGIELGWADVYQVPIVCIYKRGSKISGALKVVSSDFIEYENETDMISKLTEFFTKAKI
jgi:hypothetical protein